MKRTLKFTVTVPADITAGEGEEQKQADAETAVMVLPKMAERLSYLNATVTYEGSENGQAA
jgi:hypothetical protein